MGLNFDKIKKRQIEANKTKEERNAPKINLEKWSPGATVDKGETKNIKFRFVCTEDGDPLKQLFFHFDIPGGPVLCPKRNYGEACPICEYASSLWKAGDEASQEAAKKLFVSERYVGPVVARGEINESGEISEDYMKYKDPDDGKTKKHGVRWYGFGVKAYKKFLGHMMNPQYGDITDPDKGFDYTLTYSKPKNQGPKGPFPGSEYEIDRLETPLAENKKEVARLLKSIPDVDKVFERLSTAQVQERLDKFLETPDNSEGDRKYGDDEGGDGDSVNSVDDAISELRNESD